MNIYKYNHEYLPLPEKVLPLQNVKKSETKNHIK